MWHKLGSVTTAYTGAKLVRPAARRAVFSTFRCVNCDNHVGRHEVPDFFCKSCAWPMAPEAVRGITLYELFRMEPTYTIDKDRLSQTHKQYQFLLHPDRHYGRAPRELELITSNSSLVSTSYNTLADDKKRARYLFEITYGREVGPRKRQAFEEHINEADEGQLEYIMEVLAGKNAQVHEKVDSIASERERDDMREEFRRKIGDTVAEIGRAFRENDRAGVIERYKTLSYFGHIFDQLNR